jgi:hypothetical protein
MWKLTLGYNKLQTFQKVKLNQPKIITKIIQLIYLLEQFWTSQVTSVLSIQVVL